MKTKRLCPLAPWLRDDSVHRLSMWTHVSTPASLLAVLFIPSNHTADSANRPLSSEHLLV